MHKEGETAAGEAAGARGSHFISFIKLALIALLIITPFRYFIAQPFIVSGTSMAPTLNVGEYLVIDKLTYRSEEPVRGDVIIFQYPLDPAIYFVKRIIGLPGESVEVREGRVIVSGATTTMLAEPYVTGPPGKDAKPVTLGAGEYYVLGDNRDESADSRTWGPLQKRYIVGRALMQWFPLSEARLFPGKYEFK